MIPPFLFFVSNTGKTFRSRIEDFAAQFWNIACDKSHNVDLDTKIMGFFCQGKFSLKKGMV
jgi:hypothetical protein